MWYRTIQQNDALLATVKSSLCYTEPFNRTIRYWQPWNPAYVIQNHSTERYAIGNPEIQPMLYRTIQQNDTLLATVKSSLCYTEPFNRTIRYWQPWNPAYVIQNHSTERYAIGNPEIQPMLNRTIQQNDTLLATVKSSLCYTEPFNRTIRYWQPWNPAYVIQNNSTERYAIGNPEIQPMLYRTIQRNDMLLATLKSSLCYTEPFNRTIRYWQPWNSSIKKFNIRRAWGDDLKWRDHVFQFNGLISQSGRTAGVCIGTFDSEEIDIWQWRSHIDFLCD